MSEHDPMPVPECPGPSSQSALPTGAAALGKAAPHAYPPAPAKPVAALAAENAGRPATRHGAARGIRERLKGLAVSRAAATAVRADDEGRVPVPPTARTTVLPPVPSQDDGVCYSLVASGLPLPPGAGAYVVEHPAGTVVGRPAGPAARGSRVDRASIVAYVDAFGRAFSAGSVQAMPPGRTPDVQFKHYTDAAAHTGCVEVSTGPERAARLAEYDEGPRGVIELVGARVQLGDAARCPDLTQAVAVAFVALWLRPRAQGVSLASVSVRDVLGHLRTSDLFAALGAVLADARVAEAHPLLAAPGVLQYMAYNLRAAGLEGLQAADLAPRDSRRAGAGVPFAEGIPGLQQAPAGSLMAAMRAAFEASGIPGLAVLGGQPGTVAPAVRLVRTSAYANAFYVGFDRRRVSAEGARKLLEAESLLNRFVLLVEELDRAGAVQTAPARAVAELDAWIVDGIAELARPYVLGTALEGRKADTGSPDLDTRLSFARGCESLRLPFRFEYGFRYDDEGKTLVVEVDCPSAVFMPRVVWDAAASRWKERPRAEREGLASRYALHLMVLVAAVGFWAGPSVQRVAVNCWRGLGSSSGVDEDSAADGVSLGDTACCVATAVFERPWLQDALATREGQDACGADPFAFVGRVRHGFSLGADGDLRTVHPLVGLDDSAFHPAGAALPPELDGRELTERGAALLHAKSVGDLGIYENTARKAAAEEVVDAFCAYGEQAALDAVKDIHDRTENLLVRGACLRVSDAIASGACGEGSRGAVVEMLSDVYGMQAAMAQALKALKANPAAACAQLERMLAVADEQRWFADTPTRRYRYFDSYASRMLYGSRCPEADDGRDLRLVADEYYLGHYRLASILADSLDHGEEAIAHARRCVELAPSVAASYLRLARCYFCVFDYLSEIDVLREGLRVAWNPSDVGLALYWLGYAFCMVDAYDAGMACYQASSRYDRGLAESSSAEMADFGQRRDMPVREFSEAEQRSVLREAGVDLDQVDANVAFLMQAAGAAADARSYALARNLATSAEMSLHDDALTPVIESLED